MSPELADALILEFIFRWNVKTAIKCKGQRDFGFYDLEILDRLVRVDSKVWKENFFPEWTCTPLFSEEELEVFGCGRQIELPQPDDTVENGESESDNDDCILVDDANPREQLTSSGAYNEDELTQAIYLSTNRRAPGVYLAEKEGLSNICAPVETNEEIELFIELAPSFVTGKTLNFLMMAKAFNERVASAGYFSIALRFKMTSHIEDYAKHIFKEVVSNQQIAPILHHLKETWRALRTSGGMLGFSQPY